MKYLIVMILMFRLRSYLYHLDISKPNI